MAERTPWPHLLATALSLGLAPESFWRLSIKEWRALAAPAADSLTRQAFETLTRRFPDEPR